MKQKKGKQQNKEIKREYWKDSVRKYNVISIDYKSGY